MSNYNSNVLGHFSVQFSFTLSKFFNCSLPIYFFYSFQSHVDSVVFCPQTFFSLWPVHKHYPCSLRIDSTRPPHPSRTPPPPSTTHPSTSFIHVSIRTCHSLSVRPFISPGHRFSLNGWISSPWHFGHHVHSAISPQLTICPIQLDR